MNRVEQRPVLAFLVALAAVGAMCAILYYHTGSLWSAIFLHAFHNAFTLAISLIALG